MKTVGIWRAGPAALALLLVAAIAAAYGSSGPATIRPLPLYFGFFPADNNTEAGLKQLARETLLAALGIEEVRRLYCEFTNHSLDTPVANLSRFAYANPTAELHVTSFYCNYGAVPACAAYAARPAVQAAVGGGFGLNATALLLTPRTFGYRAALGVDALKLWANGEGEAAPGQRAHLTLSTSPGVPAVQTGLDLLRVANRVGRPVLDPAGRLRVLHFQQAEFLLLLHRAVPAEFRPSDDGEGGAAAGLRPTSWLAVLAAAAWKALQSAGLMARGG
ncbi:hypothetical protein BOX15_Mlig000784g2 [Macrostomum lignano]|uniref:Uncharacterized protein n=2 Tax=Macrostomum lignano TaxID=282301 RepID=A0A267F0M3_9PLAT|nr:hypothetical protein BOX15_Mlig000784g2 [Macrostomum lignano]